MGRVTMMTAGFALLSALAGCGVQGNVAGTRQVPMFRAGCDGDLARYLPEAGKPVHRWTNGDGACAATAGSDGEPVQAGSARQVQPDTQDVASGGATGATDNAGSRVGTETEAFAQETSGGKGGSGGIDGFVGGLFGTGGNGGAGGSGDAGGVGGNGGIGGSGTESGTTDGTGGTGGSGETGTGTGGSGAGDGSQTASGETAGSGGTSGTGETGTETGNMGSTGSEPVREFTGKPEDGITGRPENVGPPPSNVNAGGPGNSGNRGRN
jgi:hypothetical protein